LYGKLKPNPSPLKLSKSEINNKCTQLLITSINFYLIIPDINNKSDFEIATEESMDLVSDVLQTKTADTMFETKEPLVVKAELQKPIEKQETLKTNKKGNSNYNR
jgi:hypothetical protein